MDTSWSTDGSRTRGPPRVCWSTRISGSSISALAPRVAPRAIGTSSSTAASAAGMDDTSAQELLSVEALQLAFGGLQVLDGVSFAVRRGEIFALVGPNGAGKTSVLNCVNGIYRANSCRIAYALEEITGRAPHRIARLGIARSFQLV